MASALKLLSAAVLVLSILVVTGAEITGNGQQCELSSVEVRQTNVGPRVGLDTVIEVEVVNRCRCTVTDVTLSAEGFGSSTPVDPKLFRLEGDSYLVNDGKGIPSSSSVKFRYSWNRFFRMAPAGFQAVCS